MMTVYQITVPSTIPNANKAWHVVLNLQDMNGVWAIMTQQNVCYYEFVLIVEDIKTQIYPLDYVKRRLKDITITILKEDDKRKSGVF